MPQRKYKEKPYPHMIIIGAIKSNFAVSSKTIPLGSEQTHESLGFPTYGWTWRFRTDLEELFVWELKDMPDDYLTEVKAHIKKKGYNILKVKSMGIGMSDGTRKEIENQRVAHGMELEYA